MIKCHFTSDNDDDKVELHPCTLLGFVQDRGMPVAMVALNSGRVIMMDFTRLRIGTMTIAGPETTVKK